MNIIVFLLVSMLSNAAMAAPLGLVVDDHMDSGCPTSRSSFMSDYRSAPQSMRAGVEAHHFNDHYQAYRLGKTRLKVGVSGNFESPESGFSYTLQHALPNHPRALAAVEDMAFKRKTAKLDNMAFSAECYFQRAVHFFPEDAMVRVLYGYFFARRKQPDNAEQQIAKAIDLSPLDVNVLVYAASSYLEMNKLDKAVNFAREAYAAGYPLPGLRTRLEKLGRSLDQGKPDGSADENSAKETLIKSVRPEPFDSAQDRPVEGLVNQIK